MEKENAENRSKVAIAVILIAAGVLWMLTQLNIHLHFWELFQPFGLACSRIGRVFFSWPMILVLVGVILLAGKRTGGVILIIIGGVFLIPRIFIIPGFSFSMIFPLILIIAGVAIIAKRI